MKGLFALLLVLTLWSCQSSNQAGATAVSPDGYTLESVAGTDLIKASKYDPDGLPTEIGFLLNGQMEGTWMYYEHLTKEFPKRVATYHQGKLEGLYLEMTERGQIDVQAIYENGQLNGPWGIYKFGRPVKTATYKDGELDGIYREYSATDGKLQKEIQYKDGKEDGYYRYFNEDGQVTLEYQFKNGEKISGGIVETGNDNAPK